MLQIIHVKKRPKWPHTADGEFHEGGFRIYIFNVRSIVWKRTENTKIVLEDFSEASYLAPFYLSECGLKTVRKMSFTIAQRDTGRLQSMSDMVERVLKIFEAIPTTSTWAMTCEIFVCHNTIWNMWYMRQASTPSRSRMFNLDTLKTTFAG